MTYLYDYKMKSGKSPSVTKNRESWIVQTSPEIKNNFFIYFLFLISKINYKK